MPAVIVQVSHPYKSIDHTYVFKTFNLVENDIFLFLRMALIFWKEAFAMAILFLISVLHLPSDVNVYPRYLNFCTCLICSPLLKSLHAGLFFFLDTTIHSVFFTFRDNPSFSLSSTTIFRKTQFVFVPDKGTRNAIFTLSMLMERCIEVQKDLYICFIDYSKAFDKVKHEKLFEMLNQLDIDGKDLRVLRNLYWDQTAAVRVGGELSEIYI